MATLAEFTAQAENTPLGSIFAELPGETFEVERIKEHSDSFAAYFWITDLVTDSVEESLHEKDIFRSVDLINSLGNDYLFRADWNPDQNGILQVIFETDVILESASLSLDKWYIRLRSDTAEPLSAFQNECRDYGFRVEMDRFPVLVQVYGDQEYNLTDEQRASLVLGYEKGYFEEPRETTLGELAETFDITSEAVLARIRKGERNLIENTIVRSTNDLTG